MDVGESSLKEKHRQFYIHRTVTTHTVTVIVKAKLIISNLLERRLNILARSFQPFADNCPIKFFRSVAVAAVPGTRRLGGSSRAAWAHVDKGQVARDDGSNPQYHWPWLEPGTRNWRGNWSGKSDQSHASSFTVAWRAPGALARP